MQIKSFFSKWFYISIISILFGLIFASVGVSHPSHKYLFNLTSGLFLNIGLAIFVANIFTFTIGTNEFLNYIRKLLTNIILSKEFITKLNQKEQKEQKELLHMVLKPTTELSKIYSGINDYFNQYIENSMKLFDTCYRGHVVLDATASYNTQKECIQTKLELDYMVYKIGDTFESMRLGFEDESFEHIGTKIRASDRPETEIPAELITEASKIDDPTIKKLYAMEVPEEFNYLSQINVSRKIIEYGNDHWQVFSYKTIKACDRLTVILRCQDDLVKKSCNIYGIQDQCIIEKEENYVKVIFNDWLSPGFGVNILVAKKLIEQNKHR